MADIITVKGIDYEVTYIEDLENGTDAQKKHTPHIELCDKGAFVTIGNFGISHPQTEEHYIGWIRVLQDGQEIAFAEFDATMTPELKVEGAQGAIVAQAWCNLHGVFEARA